MVFTFEKKKRPSAIFRIFLSPIFYSFQLYTCSAKDQTKSKDWFGSLAVDMFNKLPAGAHTVSLPRFKYILGKWLRLNPFYSIEDFLIQILVWNSDEYIITYMTSIHSPQIVLMIANKHFENI